MTKLLIGMVIVTYFARFNKSGKTTLFPQISRLQCKDALRNCQTLVANESVPLQFKSPLAV